MPKGAAQREGVLPSPQSTAPWAAQQVTAAAQRGCRVSREADASSKDPDKQGDTSRVPREGTAQALVPLCLQQPRRGQKQQRRLDRGHLPSPPRLENQLSAGSSAAGRRGNAQTCTGCEVWAQDLRDTLLLPVLGTSCKVGGPWGGWSARCCHPLSTDRQQQQPPQLRVHQCRPADRLNPSFLRSTEDA